MKHSLFSVSKVKYSITSTLNLPQWNVETQRNMFAAAELLPLL